MADVAAKLARALPGVLVRSDDADRVAYARDLWSRHHLAVRAGHVAAHKPAAIAWPTSTEQVADVVRWAHDTGTPIVPFGAGSGVCAGVLPSPDMIVLDLKRMARWRSFDPEGRVLDVEAGHMGLPLEEDLNRRGLTLGHFPSSILCSTVGGWVAARSAGQCSGRYGKIEDMVLALECVTGTGDVVTLRHRAHGPSLVPLVVGSEGTLGVVTSATLRLHPAPRTRVFSSFSFPSTKHGWEAMRAMFQAGLRPAVARLYDPFDAMLARRGSVKKGGVDSAPPGFGALAARTLLRRPGVINELLESALGDKLLGGSLLVLVFEGEGQAANDAARARGIATTMRGSDEGEGPARRWFDHRYAVSYRQAPVFAAGLFSDTMEVAAPWSKLEALYDNVRRALGKHVFVMAHLSHAYPDGCCIYFSFVGTGGAPRDGTTEDATWDERCEATYDRAWKAALDAVVASGGTIAHHHGVGRSKAPKLRDELGEGGVATVEALMRAFDPKGILNPGSLRSEGASSSSPRPAVRDDTPVVIDEDSLLVRARGDVPLDVVERALERRGLTLNVAHDGTTPVGAWLADGAKGAPTALADPADHLVAGIAATLASGRTMVVPPAPRRAAGPDLTALVVGTKGRFATVDHAWLRAHRKGATEVRLPLPAFDLDTDVSSSEASLFDAIARALVPGT